MKVVINTEYGGFCLKDSVCELLGCDDPYSRDVELRTNPQLISLIEELGAENVEADYSALEIAEIPDDATDWDIQEYDGSETIVYVLDGKLHYC